MKYKQLAYSLAAVICLSLTGCSKTIQPGDYDASDVGKVKKVVPGVIISKRSVNIHNKNAESGVIGAGTNLSPITGAVPTTDLTDTSMMRSHGFEYVIRLNSGAIISVVQTEDLNLKSKQHILVIYGDNTRVVADDGSEDS
ncbi:MAG: hypothetical protein ABI597_06040 [Gammaproteobacteria bacterium]